MSDFKVKIHKIRFPLGLCPRPLGASLQHPRPLSVFKGPTFKVREGKKGGKEGREGKGKESEEKKRGEKGRGVEGSGPKYFCLEPPLVVFIAGNEVVVAGQLAVQQACDMSDFCSVRSSRD